MGMTKERLKRYQFLKRELIRIDKKLDNLDQRRTEIPVVIGKVTGSMQEFPYTAQRFSVPMDEPVASDELARRMKELRNRRETVQRQIEEIEAFVAGIPDDTDREIFEMLFLEGKSQRMVADMIGYNQSSVSRRTQKYLKDASNA